MTMIFLYAVPVLSGFSNYLWPLLLGSRDMAFPRLNALSYWIYLASGLFMYAGFVIGAGPNDGWFNYVPYALARLQSRPQHGFLRARDDLPRDLDHRRRRQFHRHRCSAPARRACRSTALPIMVWGTLTASVGEPSRRARRQPGVLPAVDGPPVRHAFLRRREGGQPLLWQHLFWMFGHPWVYAIVLPAMGMVSDGLPVFCRRPLVGYTVVALATVATMFLGFGVWVHHMFATGLPSLALSFFSGASIIIAVPSAVAVFAWIATIWLGRPVITTAFLFFSSMIVLFVIGGVSGFMTGSVPVDWQLTDTYFVVAHIHYVLIGINVFPVVGGHLFLVPQDDRPDARRAARALEFLDDVHRLQPRLPADAFDRPAGACRAASTPIRRHGLGHAQPDHQHRLVRVRRRRPAVPRQRRASSLRRGTLAGANPWDAPTLEWSVAVAAAALQFRGHSRASPAAIRCGRTALDETAGRRRCEEGLLLDHGRRPSARRRSTASPTSFSRCPAIPFAPYPDGRHCPCVFVGLSSHCGGSRARLPGDRCGAVIAWLWPERGLARSRSARPCLT